MNGNDDFLSSNVARLKKKRSESQEIQRPECNDAFLADVYCEKEDEMRFCERVYKNPSEDEEELILDDGMEGLLNLLIRPSEDDEVEMKEIEDRVGGRKIFKFSP